VGSGTVVDEGNGEYGCSFQVRVVGKYICKWHN
jgi:hypothetical protein